MNFVVGTIYNSLVSWESSPLRQMCNLLQFYILKFFCGLTQTSLPLRWKTTTCGQVSLPFHVIGSYFFDRTCNGVWYLEKLRNFYTRAQQQRDRGTGVVTARQCFLSFHLTVREFLITAFLCWWTDHGPAKSLATAIASTLSQFDHKS
jgi:hypothetical protein